MKPPKGWRWVKVGECLVRGDNRIIWSWVMTVTRGRCYYKHAFIRRITKKKKGKSK